MLTEEEEQTMLMRVDSDPMQTEEEEESGSKLTTKNTIPKPARISTSDTAKGSPRVRKYSDEHSREESIQSISPNKPNKKRKL